MKTLALLLLLLPCLAQAAEKFRQGEPLLTPAATAKTGRKLASVKEEPQTNLDIFRKLPVGARAITQNSFGTWNNEVVKVIEIFEDNSVRIKFADGRSPIVQLKNFKKNLSPASQCGTSHGTKICKGDMVFYPLASASLMIPEAKVVEVFENNQALLRDGNEFQLDLKQVGKSLECSPKRETICVGNHVLAEGYKDGARYMLEGPIEKVYSHGPVLVRVSPTLLVPIDVSAVKKRVAAEAVIEDPAVYSSRDYGQKGSWSVMPNQIPKDRILEELEALDGDNADAVKEAR